MRWCESTASVSETRAHQNERATDTTAMVRVGSSVQCNFNTDNLNMTVTQTVIYL